MSLERGGGSRDGSEGSVGDARAEGEVEGGGGGVAREHGRAAERDGAVGGGRREADGAGGPLVSGSAGG